MKIVFDIGGTNMRIGSSNDGKTLKDIIKIPTPADDPRAGISAICDAARRLASDTHLEALSGGIAGVFNRDHTELVRSSNIGGWVGYPIHRELSQELDVPVILQNDTAVVGLGEAFFGAGEAAGIMAYITVSTGVGGVRIVDGCIDRAAFGFEIGHQYIDVDRSLCPDCPEPGDLESYISGKSLETRFGKKPYDIEDPALWEHEARLLAAGLFNTIVHWSPEVIVLGGAMIIGSPCIELEHVKRHLASYMTIFPELPELRIATCGDNGGLMGALALIENGDKYN